MVANIATAVATSAHRWFAAGFAVLLVLSTAAAVVIPHASLLVIPAFQPMIAAAIMLSGFVTAYLLFGQFKLSGVPSLAVLATGFVFCALMSGVHTLVVEGVPQQAGVRSAGPSSAGWIWHFWHVGQLLFLVGFALVQLRFSRTVVASRKSPLWPLAASAATLAAAALSALATLGETVLPSLAREADSELYAAFAVLAGIVALQIFVITTRCRTLLQLWLAVALLAATLEAVLAVVSAPFSFGWYWAGFSGLFAAASVLVVVGHEMTVLYGRLDELNHRLEKLALVDRLSGLPNRRQLDQRLRLEWRRAMRVQAPVSVAMIDIDWFKLFNDTYGHPQGDQCIRRIAGAIGAAARRPTDLAARYGGEEFAVIMAGTDEAGARQLAERILDAIRAERIPHQRSASGFVTASIGVATHRPRPGESRSRLVEAADQALYRAKELGRDRATAGAFEPLAVAEASVAATDEEAAEDWEASDPETAGAD